MIDNGCCIRGSCCQQGMNHDYVQCVCVLPGDPRILSCASKEFCIAHACALRAWTLTHILLL